MENNKSAVPGQFLTKMFYDTANTSPSMRLTKTQQVTTSFFPTPAEQNTTGKQQQLFTSALCEHQEDFARETREGKCGKKKKKKDTLATTP